MKSEDEKAKEIFKKRRLAAKGLKERRDGKPIDPMEDVGTLGIDTDPDDPETYDEKEKEIADRAIPIGLGVRK